MDVNNLHALIFYNSFIFLGNNLKMPFIRTFWNRIMIFMNTYLLGWLNFDECAQISFFPGLWPDFVQTWRKKVKKVKAPP